MQRVAPGERPPRGWVGHLARRRARRLSAAVVAPAVAGASRVPAVSSAILATIFLRHAAVALVGRVQLVEPAAVADGAAAVDEGDARGLVGEVDHPGVQPVDHLAGDRLLQPRVGDAARRPSAGRASCRRSGSRSRSRGRSPRQAGKARPAERTIFSMQAIAPSSTPPNDGSRYCAGCRRGSKAAGAGRGCRRRRGRCRRRRAAGRGRRCGRARRGTRRGAACSRACRRPRSGSRPRRSRRSSR